MITINLILKVAILMIISSVAIFVATSVANWWSKQHPTPQKRHTEDERIRRTLITVERAIKTRDKIEAIIVIGRPSIGIVPIDDIPIVEERFTDLFEELEQIRRG